MLADSQSFRVFNCPWVSFTLSFSPVLNEHQLGGKMLVLLSQPMAHVKLKVSSKSEHIVPVCQGVVCGLKSEESESFKRGYF